MLSTPYQTYKAEPGLKLPRHLLKSLPEVPQALRHSKKQESSKEEQPKLKNPQILAGLKSLKHQKTPKRHSRHFQDMIERFLGMTRTSLKKYTVEAPATGLWSNRDTARLMERPHLTRRYWIQSRDPFMRIRRTSLFSQIS